MGNILWIASYPKSGNTWMRAFIGNYIKNESQPVNINTINETYAAEASAYRYNDRINADRNTTDLTTEELCAIRPMVHADMAREAHGTRFVKTHNFLGQYKGYPLHNSSVTSGMIYIVRNPLDVTISMARYFGYSIDETIAYMAEEMTGTSNEKENVPQIITSWSMHVSSWTENPEAQRLVLRYEDMLDKPLKAFRKVESFLGLKKDPKRLKKAINFSSFNQLKIQEKKHGFIEKHENAQTFFRQGKKHQWKDVLSVEQVEKIVDLHRAQMLRFKYIPK